MPVLAEESAPSELLNQPTEELATKTTKKLPDNNIEVQEIPTTKNMYKQPVSKKKIAKKFLLAMAGVAISSIFLYLALTLYNTIRKGLTKTVSTETKEASLETPDDMQSAIKVFLDKTNWNN